MNAALLGSIAAIAWGFHDFLARFPSQRIGAVNAAFAVTLAGLLALSAWLLINGEALTIVWPSLWLAAVTGFSFAVATVALYAALAIGPISVVAPVAGSYPALALIFAVVAGERPALTEWLAVAAVMAGVVAVAQHKQQGEPTDTGKSRARITIIGLALVASFGFAVAFTSGQIAVHVFGEAQSVWLARIFGLLTISLIYLRASVRWQMPARWMPVLGAMGLLDVTAMVLVIAAASLPDPALATVTSSAFGAVTVVLARIFLKERISPIQFIGIVLIFGGVVVLASR